MRTAPDFTSYRLHGVHPGTAPEAARRCEQAVLKNGALGAVGMGLLGMFAISPVAGLGAPAAATLGLVVGSGGTLVASEQCTEVRDAAFSIVNSTGY